MAKKSKKQRAKQRTAQIRPESVMRLRAEHAPVVEAVVEDVILVEFSLPSKRDVEETLAAVAEEHRASQRVAVAVDIHLASESHFFSGLSGDISEGGLFLSTYRPLPIGSTVDLEFSLPGSDVPVQARGEVRWLREHSTGQPRGVGIAFDELAEDDRERVHRFCTMRPPLYYDDVG